MSDQQTRGISVALRNRGKAAWAAATSHPMVAEIGAGTLPHRIFRGYFEQNILYLQDYARSVALIVGKAPDLDAIVVLTRFLQQIVMTEIPANIAFLKRLGGSPAETSAYHPVTYNYTRHLLYCAAQGTCADGLAALLPCQWSYGELAVPLMASPPVDSVYVDWVSMFGDDSYRALINESSGLLDRLTYPGDDGTMDRLASVFDASTRYEVQFWDMAYGVSQSWPPGKEPVPSCELPESLPT
jgi:thiaminase (transcriptional activator TenA)